MMPILRRQSNKKACLPSEGTLFKQPNQLINKLITDFKMLFHSNSEFESIKYNNVYYFIIFIKQ